MGPKVISAGLTFAVWWLIFFRCILPTPGQSWEWSPAAPHQAAVCEVRSGDRAGSGVYVRFGALRGVLTAAHIVIAGESTVRFSDGAEQTARTTVDKFGHDVAFVFCTHPTIAPVPICEVDPIPGERAEMLTYGGPSMHTLRRFWAVVEATQGDVTRYRCDVISGDSGGAILNGHHELIGIQAHGYEPIPARTGWYAYHGGGSASCRPIRAFLGRVLGCGPGGCAPAGCPVPPAAGAGQAMYPPAVSPEIPPTAEPPAVPAVMPAPAAEAPQTEIDYDRLAELIYARILADADKFRPPAGPPGPAGETGPRGPPGESTTIDLDALAAEIGSRLPPITFQALGSDGANAGDPVKKHLGEVLRIKSFLVEKP